MSVYLGAVDRSEIIYIQSESYGKNPGGLHVVVVVASTVKLDIGLDI